jgi:site-specific DNA-methyltransferase (adenine-specific)
VDRWLNQIIEGDCLEVMKEIPDKSVDMILCDLPYGTTACKWDTVIPFEPLWEQYERIIKDNGAIVLMAAQPFTSALVMSNPKMFRHQWIWNKRMGSNFFNVKSQPLKIHEEVVVFSKKRAFYNPVMRLGEMRAKGSDKQYSGDNVIGDYKKTKTKNNLYYPVSILDFSNASRTDKVHPTQKPVALFEYLIRTYTNEGEIVLDNCAGSFTTAVACDNTNRNWICIEKEEEYCNIGLTRVNDNRKRLGLPLLNSINSTIVV